MTAAKSSFTELPTIDISDLNCDDLARRQAVADAYRPGGPRSRLFHYRATASRPELIAGVARRQRDFRPADGTQDGVLRRAVEKP